jgi:hypothetical protein
MKAHSPVMMPVRRRVRISGGASKTRSLSLSLLRSLGPLRNAATVTSCKCPAFKLPVSFSGCYYTASASASASGRVPENQELAEDLRNQRRAHAAHNGGHGGAARPCSCWGYGSLSESAVEPKPASESVNDCTLAKEVVNRSSASPSSRAAAALAAARALSAAPRNGRTTRPARCSSGSFCELYVDGWCRYRVFELPHQ